MSAPTNQPSAPEDESARTRRRRRLIVVSLVAVALIAALILAWWILREPPANDIEASPSPSPSPSLTESPSPSPSPSPSESASPDPTPAPPAEATFYDVNGRWCQDPDFADVWAEEPCFTIDLPHITYDPRPDEPAFVFPGSGSDSEPSTWQFDDVERDAGGCWRTVTDGWPPMSGLAFIFCPAGAESMDGYEILGDPAVDHVFVTHEWPTPGYIRADA